jgi:hypothetical protein
MQQLAKRGWQGPPVEETREKIDAWRGRGHVRLTSEDHIEVYYEIAAWRTPDGALHFEGRIEADTATASAIGQARGPIALTMSDGTSIDVLASERGSGRAGWPFVCRCRFRASCRRPGRSRSSDPSKRAAEIPWKLRTAAAKAASCGGFRFRA